MSVSKQIPNPGPPGPPGPQNNLNIPNPQNNMQQRQPYMHNPPHVQQQFLILPPGQIPSQLPVQVPSNQQVLSLNPNNIAIPTPNYNYSRIGPNNQGLLSPTTLTNKLKVI